MLRFPGRLAFAFAVVVAAAIVCGAQKAEPAKQMEMPPSTPMMTPADLAAKVPTAEAGRCEVPGCDHPSGLCVDLRPGGCARLEPFPLDLPAAGAVHGGGKKADGGTIVISWGVEDFIRDAGAIFAKEPFYENGIVNEAAGYGNMRQVFSSYESRRAPGEKPFSAASIRFKLLNDGKRWWIVSDLLGFGASG